MSESVVSDFSLSSTGESPFRLSEVAARYVVLYFYPKDNTPGCTNQSEQFRDLHDQFVEAGAAIYGISRDSLKSHENFKRKLELPFELLVDEEEQACGLFDVIKTKNLYGKQVRGIERSTFVLDKEGRILREWRRVKVPGHAQEVLDFIRSL